MQNRHIAHWLTRHFYRMSCHVAKQRSAYLCVGSALSRMLMRPAEKSAPWAARSSMTDRSNASDVTIFCLKIKNQINLSLGTRGMECLNPRLPYPFIHLNLWNPYPFIITPALIFYRGVNTDVYHTLVDRQSRLNWVDEWSLFFFLKLIKINGRVGEAVEHCLAFSRWSTSVRGVAVSAKSRTRLLAGSLCSLSLARVT